MPLCSSTTLSPGTQVDPEIQAGILRAAIAAPSADNSQPWRFAWRDDGLDLRIDANRSGRVSDTRHVLSDLAAGACLENIVVQARAAGLTAEVAMFPRDDDPLWVAHLGFRRDSGRDAGPNGDLDQPEPLAAALAERHTDRRFPWHGPIDPSSRARLDAQAQAIPGARLWWPATSHERKAAVRAIRQAEALRFRSPLLHAEMFSSIRFAAGWHAPCEEGLAPATLAVEAPLRAAFQAMRLPQLMRTLNRLGAASMLGWRSAWLPIRLSPGLALVVVSSSTRASVLAGGRALQRVWLQATLDGLSVQPYAAAGVLGLGFVPLESAFQRSRARIAAAMDDLCGPGRGLVFLRLGRAGAAPTVRSGRRPPASFGPGL